MERLLLIYNPQAGTGFGRRHLSQVVEVFTRCNYLTTVCPTMAKGDATRITRQWAGDFDRVVCCGGDGTLNEVVTGLLAWEAPPPLGYVPAGTTNDFSRNLHLPQGIEAVANVAARGEVRPCDMGRFGGKNFVYIAAFGVFTDVSYGTSQEMKKAFGQLAYLVEGALKLGDLTNYYTLEVEHDGGRVQGDFLFGMVSNTTSVGGFQMLPPEKVALDDGLFEVVLVRRPEKIGDLQDALRNLARQAPQDSRRIEVFHTKHLNIQATRPVPWTLDGEFGGEHSTVEVEILPKAVELAFGG